MQLSMDRPKIMNEEQKTDIDTCLGGIGLCKAAKDANSEESIKNLIVGGDHRIRSYKKTWIHLVLLTVSHISTFVIIKGKKEIDGDEIKCNLTSLVKREVVDVKTLAILNSGAKVSLCSSSFWRMIVILMNDAVLKPA